jgi:hypothetical protein
MASGCPLFAGSLVGLVASPFLADVRAVIYDDQCGY